METTDNTEKNQSTSGREEISTSSLQEALSGADFPATKKDLVDQATDNGADAQIISALQSLEDKEYREISEVQRSFSKTQV